MAAAASLPLVLAFLACSSETPPEASSPSPGTTVARSPSPSAVASGDETAVAPQILPPATDLPVAHLCSRVVATTSDGNVGPLFCRDGALNVQAWTFYSSISASILSLGLNPTQGQAMNAMCDDMAHNGAKRVQEVAGYRLAAAYYGWAFTFDPAKVICQ